MMGKTITILSIHSCFGQKIGIGNAGGLNIYVHNLITYLLSKNHKIIFITSSHEYCELEDKENLKICLIEDDESLRFTIKEILEKQDVQIMEAENGKVGMYILQNEEIKPDLILLDLMMPIMNGFEFLKAIRETELNSIPILVLTGAELSEDEKKFLSGETQKILEKSEDTMSTIVNEVSNVIKASSFKNGDNK